MLSCALGFNKEAGKKTGKRDTDSQKGSEVDSLVAVVRRKLEDNLGSDAQSTRRIKEGNPCLLSSFNPLTSLLGDISFFLVLDCSCFNCILKTILRDLGRFFCPTVLFYPYLPSLILQHFPHFI